MTTHCDASLRARRRPTAALTTADANVFRRAPSYSTGRPGGLQSVPRRAAAASNCTRRHWRHWRENSDNFDEKAPQRPAGVEGPANTTYE